MTPERLFRLRQVLQRRQTDLTVITDGVHKGRNLSAIIRNCDAVGIGGLHVAIPERGFRAFRGTAMGSQKWVQPHFYDNVMTPIESLQKQGYQVVAAHLSDKAIVYDQIDYTQPTALLMGAEKHGASQAALDAADHHIIIPMQGMVESFNVASACAIILVEAQKQRLAAGLYREQQLDEHTYQTLFFEWAHPVITRYCREKGIDYPSLDSEGEIANAAEWYHSVKALPVLYPEDNSPRAPWDDACDDE